MGGRNDGKSPQRLPILALEVRLPCSLLLRRGMMLMRSSLLLQFSTSMSCQPSRIKSKACLTYRACPHFTSSLPRRMRSLGSVPTCKVS